ncbi:MAG TPA: hypothetical protein VGC54_03090 [Planctomycetota bacterium]
MSPRNRVLLVVFVLLGAAALAVLQPWRGDAFARTAARVRPLFPELDERRQTIARIEIDSGAASTRLELTDAGWIVRDRFDHPADGTRLADLVDVLAALDDREIVATEPASFATYEVREGDGTRVRVWDREGRLLADLIGGALRHQDVLPGGPALFEFYVRPAARDLVLLTQEWHVPSARPEDWILGRFLPPDAVSKIRWIQRDDRQSDQDWRVVRDETTGAAAPEGGAPHWRMVAPEDRPALDYAAESTAFTLSSMRAADAAGRLAEGATEPAAEFGFSTDVFRAGMGEGSFEIHLGAPAGDGGHYAWVPGNPFVYVLGDFEVGQLRQPVAAMLPGGD